MKALSFRQIDHPPARLGRMEAGLPRPLIALLLGLSLLAGLTAESRSASIDLILLIDKSLSMETAFPEAQRYAASEIIAPLMLPGDRLIIEAFYGQVERLFAGMIRSEEDKARAIRSLTSLEANGRFTDIGSALDRAEADLAELGAPERPKYVLLLTDERQEAPGGSPYQSPDFVPRHPALEYVKKTDLGGFRLITVGFDASKKVDAAAGRLFNLLETAPQRNDADHPSLPPEASADLSGGMALEGGQEAVAFTSQSESGTNSPEQKRVGAPSFTTPGAESGQAAMGANPTAPPSSGQVAQNEAREGSSAQDRESPVGGALGGWIAILGGIVLAGLCFGALLLVKKRKKA